MLERAGSSASASVMRPSLLVSAMTHHPAAAHSRPCACRASSPLPAVRAFLALLADHDAALDPLLVALANSSRLIDAVLIGVEPVEGGVGIAHRRGVRCAPPRPPAHPMPSCRAAHRCISSVVIEAILVGVAARRNASRTMRHDFGAGHASCAIRGGPSARERRWRAATGAVCATSGGCRPSARSRPIRNLSSSSSPSHGKMNEGYAANPVWRLNGRGDGGKARADRTSP